MTERKTGGWLSSVVGNISGLWSRSPVESAATSKESIDTRNSSRNTSYEEQAESDVCEEDDGIIVGSVCAGPSITVPTTSRTQNDNTPKRHAVRYLSPSALLAATRSVSSSTDKETVTSTTRKRAATNCPFQDNLMWPNIGNTFATSSTESLSGRLPTKRSKIQRDFSNEMSFFSSSLSDIPTSGRSHLNQSFASSFTPVMIKPKVSRSRSTATSSLSSKTRAILEQLEKISSPVKELKRLPSLNLNGPERWASDVISSAVQKPPRNSMCSLSRAQLISNILATKSNSPFWSRPTYSTKMPDSSTNSSHAVQTLEYNPTDREQESESDNVLTTKSSSLLPSKKTDLLNPSRKPDREKVFVDDNAEKSTVSSKDEALASSTSMIKTADASSQHFSFGKSTNVFSARDLGVVSPVKEIVTNDKNEMVRKSCEFGFFGNFGKVQRKLMALMFAFAPPMKRGPSASFVVKNSTKGRIFFIPRYAPLIAKTAFKSTADKTVDSFSTPAETVSKQIEGQQNIADIDKETQPVTEVATSVKPIDNDTTISDTSALKQPLQKSAEQWSCPKCMVFNKADIRKCICCGYENQLPEDKPWTCSECWISNKSSDNKCIACGNPKQSNGKAIKLTDISSQSNSFTSVFGDRTFKPLPSSGGISFGFSVAKPVTDGISLSSTTSAPPTMSTLNSSSVINGNGNIETPLKFGLSSNTLASKQPLVLSSQPPSAALTFGVSSGSSGTTASFTPSLTRSSFSFPTLTMTTSASTTLPPSETDGIKVPTTSLFTFGSSAPLSAVTASTPAVTTATPLPPFATTLHGFSDPKGKFVKKLFLGYLNYLMFSSLPRFCSTLFGTSGGSSQDGNHDVVEMSSPTTSPVASSVAAGSFVVSKSSTPSLFNFGASNASSSTSTGTLFGNLQTTVQNPPAVPSTSLFSFGQQQMPVALKPFEPSASLTSPPSTFNFGATASNGSTGFVFGSDYTVSKFHIRCAAANTTSTTFNFTPASSTLPFGNVPGSASVPNFFSVGSTSSTTARKMLKARRMRK
ncbi:hypothetical protein DINM_003746 [Dirofilaria immitis]|nr:hypothetical protein [Dirofilaria immitis]